MTDKQPESLRQAAWLKKEGASCQRHYDLGVLIERQHAELETLRAGYAAARLEIESLRAAQPAGAQQPGAAYAALSDVDSLAQEIRRVDGAHRLGAGALAEALMPFLRVSHGQAPAGAAEPTEQQILEAAFAPAQPAVEASRFGSPELQAMIIARCVEKDLAGSVLEDAARYRWLREGNDSKHSAAWHVAVNLYGCEWDAAIDAARKQGGQEP